MKKTAHIALIWLALVATFAGCNRDRCEAIEGPREAQEVVIETTSKLTLNFVSDLTIKVDSAQSPSMEVIAQNDVFQFLQFASLSDELTIDLDQCIKGYDPILMHAILTDIEHITLNSAGKIESEAILDVSKLRFTNNGLGDIDFVVNTDTMIGEIKSSGDLLLSGSCRNFNFLSTSSGDLRAYNLVSDTITLNLFGSSVCEVFSEGVLNVNFLSPSVVNYRGTPEAINIEGIGQVINANP